MQGVWGCGKASRRSGGSVEGRETYSAAIIDGAKRNSTIYVGDSIVRKTYTRLSKRVTW